MKNTIKNKVKLSFLICTITSALFFSLFANVNKVYAHTDNALTLQCPDDSDTNLYSVGAFGFLNDPSDIYDIPDTTIGGTYASYFYVFTGGIHKQDFSTVAQRGVIVSTQQLYFSIGGADGSTHYTIKKNVSGSYQNVTIADVQVYSFTITGSPTFTYDSTVPMVNESSQFPAGQKIGVGKETLYNSSAGSQSPWCNGLDTTTLTINKK